MMWTWLDTWIVITGITAASSCAVLGNFLILRRMSMMGDAISHAVLPGLAAAFLITGSRGSFVMFLGAAAVGLITALFTHAISRWGKVEESAAMGVVFTGLFAIGLIMIVRAADAVDLDPGCVLYGAIELVPLDLVRVGLWNIPRAALTTGSIFFINILVVIIFFKELKITSFDPALATTLGINAGLLHYLLMTMVAVTTVAAFESVGSILVIAMLIVPGATAYLLTERLHIMILISIIVAALSALFGHIAAITVPTWWGYSDTNTAGMMAVVAGLFFSVTLFFAPRHGILGRWLTRTLLSLRIISEDILGILYRLEEYKAEQAHVLPWPQVRKLLRVNHMMWWGANVELQRKRLIEKMENRWHLTPTGRNHAANLIRSHRLWESYLIQYLALRADHVHSTSERLEHITTSDMQRELAQRTKNPEKDPHGRAIPP